ncbi:hypothetical protein AVEN_87395-1 [Araneus ventricosus]|uniref:Uncharacterized protein n=1 Tax=Araneus ventricosus TaxID=182803 RepID=A0A4Y2RAA3_ARAVE|nr:hypothetical protein AVEN_87395-1 [Araneus ventricosus]
MTSEKGGGPLCRSTASEGGSISSERRRALNNLLKGLKQACNKSFGKSYRIPCFLLTGEPFRYLAERFNPCHGNLCDNPLPLLTTRFPKPFRQAFQNLLDKLSLLPGLVLDDAVNVFMDGSSEYNTLQKREEFSLVILASRLEAI